MISSDGLDNILLLRGNAAPFQAMSRYRDPQNVFVADIACMNTDPTLTTLRSDGMCLFGVEPCVLALTDVTIHT